MLSNARNRRTAPVVFFCSVFFASGCATPAEEDAALPTSPLATQSVAATGDDSSSPPPTPAPASEELAMNLPTDSDSLSSVSSAAPGFDAVQELPAAAETQDRVIRVLPNRMVVVVQRVATAPVVSAQVWVKTGSLYEQEHVGAGLSHFLEHLLSGGTTTTRPEAASNAELGRMGAQTNAATSLDTVRYYINTTADEAPAAIDLLSDWMQNNVVLESEYAREREVIQREFSMGDGDPNRILWKMTQQARFAATPEHPGIHPTIGYLDEFMTITRDELEAFYRRMYVPNNMAFVVAGDVDPAATADQIAALWSSVPMGELPELSFPVEPEVAGPVEVTGQAAVSRTRVRLFWTGVELASEHDYALDLAASILGSGDSSRLVRTLRDERGLVTSIDAYNYSTAWGRGFFGVDYQPAEGVDPTEVREAVIAEVDAMRSSQVTEEELARARRKVLVGVAAAGQSADALASRMASDLLSLGDPDYLRVYGEAIQTVTAEQIAEAARAILSPGSVNTVTLRPVDEGDEVTRVTRPDLAGAEPAPQKPFELDNARVIAELAESLSAEAADAAGIDLGEPEMRTLPNGLRVIVRRNTLVPVVSMQLYALGGVLADEPGREGVGNAAWSMLDRGAAGRSAKELAEFLENRGASLSTGSGNNTDFVTARALAEDWPEVMATMADVALRPDFPEAEWARLQPRLLAAIDRQTDAWSGELRSVFRASYFGSHPWSQTPLGVAEVVASLNVDDLRAAHAQRSRPGSSVLAVVGAVEPEAVFAEAERLFGGFEASSGGSFHPPVPAPRGGLEVFLTDKPVTAVQIGYGPGIARDHPDYAAMAVLTRLLSSFPSGRLEQALRGQGPGLVYASQAANVVGVVPGYFAVLFNTSADTAVEATRRAAEVIETARETLPTADELARAKARVLADEAFGKQSNAAMATDAALDTLYRVADPDGSRLRAAVAALTPEDIRDVAQRRLTDPFAAVLTQQPVDEAALREVLGLADAGPAALAEPMGAPAPSPGATPVFEK